MSANDYFNVIMILGFSLGAYFLPLVVALSRGHRNTLAVFVLNLCLGWTLVGWVVALCWAAMATQRRAT